MSQITVRASEELIEAVKQEARANGRSMNEQVVLLMEVNTNPDLAGSEVERLRERFRRAGILAETSRTDLPERPSREELEAAGREAGRGTPLSEIVIADRR